MAIDTQEHQMTTDEIRNEIARLNGWNPPDTYPELTGDQFIDATNRTTVCGKWWRREGGMLVAVPNHPFPATLDGAAAAMPVGWFWVREGASFSHRQDGLMLKWKACQRGADNWRVVETPDTGDEIHDRYALALAAMKAERGTNGN